MHIACVWATHMCVRISNVRAHYSHGATTPSAPAEYICMCWHCTCVCDVCVRAQLNVRDYYRCVSSLHMCMSNT